MSLETALSTWRSRVTRRADADPATLAAHPLNARRHPRVQADALAGLLDQVGWVADVLVNERSGRIVDGHLRVELALARAEPTVPVAYVDLDDAEERLILATLDPLAAMADTDAETLRSLLADVSTDDAALGELLASMAREAGIAPPDFEPVGIDEQGRLDQKAQVTCPECGHAFSPS